MLTVLSVAWARSSRTSFSENGQYRIASRAAVRAISAAIERNMTIVRVVRREWPAARTEVLEPATPSIEDIILGVLFVAEMLEFSSAIFPATALTIFFRLSFEPLARGDRGSEQIIAGESSEARSVARSSGAHLCWRCRVLPSSGSLREFPKFDSVP